MIVDDNDEFRKVLKMYLRMQSPQMEIHEADSGELAIAEASHQRPDVILMDIRLPLMNGIDAAIRIKEDLPKVKIIILTIFETEEFRRYQSNGVIFAFVGKSEVYDRLMPVIQKSMKGGAP